MNWGSWSFLETPLGNRRASLASIHHCFSRSLYPTHISFCYLIFVKLRSTIEWIASKQRQTCFSLSRIFCKNAENDCVKIPAKYFWRVIIEGKLLHSIKIRRKEFQSAGMLCKSWEKIRAHLFLTLHFFINHYSLELLMTKLLLWRKPREGRSAKQTVAILSKRVFLRH